MGRDEEPVAHARQLVRGYERELVGIEVVVERLDRHDLHPRVALEPEPREPAGRLRLRQVACGQTVEEVSLEPALGVGHRSRLGEFDGEQRERVARHDPVEVARLLGLTDRKERLDPPGCADRLDPDMVAAGRPA